jgi:hypothetical protein
VSIIRLAPSSDAAALIHVDNYTAPFYLGWSMATYCYRKACEDVMEAFELYRTMVPRVAIHFLLSEGSKHWIRDDRISGALLWSYNLNLLAEVVEATQCKQLHIECDAPLEFLQECRNRYSLDLIGRQTKRSADCPVGWRWKLRQGLKSLTHSVSQDIAYTKRIYANLCRRRHGYQSTSRNLANQALKCGSEIGLSGPRPTVFIGIQGLTTHRFGGLIRVLEESYNLIPFFPHEDLNKSQLDIPGLTSIYGLIGKRAFMLCIVKVLYLLGVQSLCLWLMRVRRPFFAHFFYQEYRDILQVSVSLLGLRQMFSAHGPTVVVAQGSYNGPHTKRIFNAASMAGAHTISIEQKIIFPDQFAYQRVAGDSISGMPNSYIVAHKASGEALVSWGIDPKKVKVGYRGPILNVEKTELDTSRNSMEYEYNKIIESAGNRQCLLLLLSDSESVNLNILTHVNHLAAEKYILLIREHPNVPLQCQPTALGALELMSWANCSSWPWSIMHSFDSAIAIAACSSAGLEAIEFGAVLIWLPFCTDLSVTYASMINSIGEICRTADELQVLAASLEDPDNYASLRSSQQRIFREMKLRPSGDLISCTLECIDNLLAASAPT